MIDYKKLNLPQERRFLGPASVLKRIFAFIVDIMLINLIIASPFMKIIERVVPKEVISYEWLVANSDITGTLYLTLFFISILGLLYFTIFDCKLGQTIGKMIMNIYVVNTPQADPNTGRKKKKLDEKDMHINILNAMVRNLIVIPFFPFILLWILDPVYMLLNKNSQRLSEKISNTMTVELMNLG